MKNETNVKNKLVSALAVMLIFTASAAYALYEHPDDIEDGNVDAVAPIIVGIAIFLGGFAVGYWAEHELSPPDAGGNQEEVNGVLRQSEAEKVTWYTDGALSVAGTALPSDVHMWGFTQEHWNRAAELAVTDTWSLALNYDPDFTTERSMMRTNVEALTYNWQAALDNALTHSVIRQIDSWSSSDEYDYLDGVSASLAWDSGSSDLRNSKIDFCQIVTSADSGSTVYIDTERRTTAGTFRSETSGTLYNLSPSPVTVREMSTGRTVMFAPGANSIAASTYTGTALAMGSGLYRIETSGATIAGPLSMTAGTDAAEVNGTMMHRSSSLTWFTFDGGTTYVNSAAGSEATQNVKIRIEYTDRDGNIAERSAVIAGEKADTDQNVRTIEDWDALIDRMNSSIASAAVAGEVIWNIFDVCQQTIPHLAPSSIITTVPGMKLTATQAAAMAADQMMQIHRAYELYGSDIRSELVKTFSPESLDLVVRGDIYYNGTPIYRDAVFTPYAALERQDFRVGETTAWKNAGFAQMWGTSPDISDWSPVDTSEYRSVPMGSGYTISVKQIGRNGLIVTEASITPEEILRYTVDPADPPSPSVPPVIKPIVDHMPLFLMIVGGLIVLIGALMRSSPIFTIGLIVCGIGVLMYFRPWDGLLDGLMGMVRR